MSTVNVGPFAIESRPPGQWLVYWRRTWKRLIEFSRPKIAFGIYHLEGHYSLQFFGVWIYLCRTKKDPVDILDSWSFSIFERALHLHWGPRRTKLFWLPWDFGSNIRHENQDVDGNFVPASGEYQPPYADRRRIYQSPYRYVRKNGAVQDVTATYFVEEREWRWRIFHRLPFPFGPKRLHRSISVDFSAAIGERVDTWKGGCTGCGYEMREGESPEMTLRRMERERKF